MIVKLNTVWKKVSRRRKLLGVFFTNALYLSLFFSTFIPYLSIFWRIKDFPLNIIMYSTRPLLTAAPRKSRARARLGLLTRTRLL